MGIKILKTRAEHAAAAVELLTETVALPYVIDDVLCADVSLVALEDDRLVGAAIATLVSAKEVMELFPPDQAGYAEKLPFESDDIVGFLTAVGVDPRQRGRGIGGRLVRERVRRLRRKGATRFLAFAWKTKQLGCHAAPILEAAGLQPLFEIDGFWREEMQEARMDCPFCGPVCDCACVIYTDTPDTSR